ncbi:alpha/beta hydrolase [Aeromicrobium halocynthiae]|uniref:Alpha/beta hydrolase n=1 Tax=Aeromicrobium halocynthiae TaxID=560557 RepID=A0ABN2W2I0_9ACTN
MTGLEVTDPVPLPPFEVAPGGRAVTSGTRRCVQAMSATAQRMSSHTAPPGWDDAQAVTAQHVLTGTVRDLEAAEAALHTGLTVLDAYLDRTDELRAEHENHQSTRTQLSRDIADFRGQAAGHTAAERSDLAATAVALRGRVDDFDRQVSAWQERLTAAEDRLIAGLAKADTLKEGHGLVARAPDEAALLRQLADLDRSDPTTVATWWASLTRAEREALKMADPEAIGSLDGIAVADRDEANRLALDALRTHLDDKREAGTLTAADRDTLDKISTVQKALDRTDGLQIEGRVVTSYLLLFDPETANGDGFAAVAYGNPETADHVSINVPGLTSTVNTFGGVSQDALNVLRSASAQTDGSVASIAWLGYDAPDAEGILDPNRGERLTAKLDALGVGNEQKAAAGAAVHPEAGRANLTVIGHSYGSTTTGKAAGDFDMDSDNVVLVGSPGPGRGNVHASDLRGTVYVGSADDDPVTRLGNGGSIGLGVDPASAEFGAIRFRVENQEAFSLSGSGLLAGLENHVSYFDSRREMQEEGRALRDSASLGDIGKVVVDRGGEVDVVPGRTGSSIDWWGEQAQDHPSYRAAGAVGEAVTDHLRRRFLPGVGQ